MRYLALATDFDGTMAHHGRVDAATVEALERTRASGRRLILVTGRDLDDLNQVFPRLDLFHRVVAENGALLYCPENREIRTLAPPPPVRFVETLRAKGVPLTVGRSIVATVEPHQREVLAAIQELGLEMHVIFNKGAVMVLNSGVNKATGLAAALLELELSPHNVVGVGDAENDHAFLAACGCAVAVANALPALMERADFITSQPNGLGLREAIDRLLENDLAGLAGERHCVLVGGSGDHEERVDPLATSFLVAGTSGSGKSTLTAGILERLADAGYQYAIIDPEGDYASLEEAVAVGDAQRTPALAELFDLLRKPGQNAVLNLLGVALEDRPRVFVDLLPGLLELRQRTGRPHLIVIDEVHHLLPAARGPRAALAPPATGMFYITVHPESVDPQVLGHVGVLLVVGQKHEETVAGFCRAAGLAMPRVDPTPLEPGEVLLWRPGRDADPVRLVSIPPRGERRRHSRKYAEGNVGPDRNFVFSGPEGKLNLRAQNLAVFLQMADGIDDETWLYHLRRGDYSAWFRREIKDEALANETADVEGQADKLPAAESRLAVRQAIERRYTLPADRPSGEVKD